MIHAVKPLPAPVKPWNPLADAPALPREVVDPGYPVNSVAQGVVILAAHLDAEGQVTSIDTITGIGSLTEPAIQAVQQWKFTPARLSGKPAPATAYVVISFVRPT
jgi:TonB family protein